MSKFPWATLAAIVAFTIAQPSFANSHSDDDGPRHTNSRPAVRLTRSEERLVDAVNDYRDQHGLAPLKVDPALMKVARCAAPYYSHCIDGKWCWTRCHEAGFRGWASDDIASGYESPEEAVQGWATSDGHARQMRGQFKMNGRWCNYRFNRIGVGICGRKYIAVFGRCNDDDQGDDS